MDTGVDGTHPDIAPNFDRSLSRNFTVDNSDPGIDDGPCEHPRSCVDPNDVDEDGHGTHVAGTIGSPLNGIGIAGVAPKVDLVNIRAGQDSGYFFLQPTVDALTYAGDNGIDVVNMSFYIDPWLFNCAATRPTRRASRREQRTIIAATQRAIELRPRHGVTLISAAGNESHRPRQPDVRRHEPGLPAGRRRMSARSTTAACASDDADRGHDVVGGDRQPASSPSARRTTRTTASSRPTSPLPAATTASSSGRRRQRARRTGSSPPTR